MTALFEHSPWVEERANKNLPSGDYHADLMNVVYNATKEERLALIRAHPELAGKAAIAKKLTAASLAEQAHAGLDQLSEIEYKQFHQLNADYKARFDFPFIICVRLHNKSEIIQAMKNRMNNDLETEISNAIEQISEIVRLRLEGLL